MSDNRVTSSTGIRRPPSLNAEHSSKTKQTSGAGANAKGAQFSLSAHRLAVKDNTRNHVLVKAGDKALTGIRDAYSLRSASQRGAIVFNAALLKQLEMPPLPPPPLSQAMLGAPMSAAAHLVQPGAQDLPPPPPPLSQAALGVPMRATTTPPRPSALAPPRPSTPEPAKVATPPPRNRATTVVQTRSVDPFTGVALKSKALERFNANRMEHAPTFTRMAKVARFIAAQEGATTLKFLKLSQSESADFGFGFAIMQEARFNKPMVMSDRERIATYTGIMSILDNVSLRSRVDDLTLAVMDGAMQDVMRKLKANEPITADDVREAFTMISMDLSIPEADAAQTAAKIGLKELATLHRALAAAGQKEIRFLADDKAVSGVGIKAIEPKDDAYRIMLVHSDPLLKGYESVMRQRASATTHQLLLALLDKWDQDSALLSSTKAAITAAKRLMATRVSKADAYIHASDVEYAFSMILADLRMSKTP
jgi:hypothetical protein